MTHKNLLGFLFFVNTLIGFGQEAGFQLSSHILDVTQGMPASDVSIKLEKQHLPNQWILVDEKKTDDNGRITNFLPYTDKKNHGIYKLTYFTAPYFKANNQKSFYPFIEVVFEILDEQHYHVPITLSPFGYSTYRGN